MKRLVIITILLCLAIGLVLYALFGHQFIKAMYVVGRPIGILLLILSFWFFLKKNIASANRSFFLAISVLILITMFVVNPKRYGDGHEYYLMTESLSNHLSPDLQSRDTQTMEKLKIKFGLRYDTQRGYYKAKDNSFYCYHFWAYPLFNLPVKFMLRALHLNELKVCQITNSVLLILALFHIIFISKLTELQKMLFSLLIVFCPALWFIHWPHPEIFSYSFVVMSLVYMSVKKWAASILCAAIAATQNQPLIFFVVFLWITGMVDSKEKGKDFFVMSLSALPAFTPNIFYYTKFGVPSLLFEKAAALNNMSIFRVWEMFFDLNIGMLPYIPVALFVFFGVVFRDILKKRKASSSIQFVLVMVVMMLFCSLTTNWNSGTSGPTRYVIWMLPLVFYVIIAQDNLRFHQKPKRSIYLSILLLAVIIQIIIVFLGGGFIPCTSSVNYLYHTPLARFVMNHFPAIYNPSKEIFIERTLHRVNELDTPVVYYNDKKCKKALAKGKDAKQLAGLCGYIPERYQNFFKNKNNEEKLKYINY